MNHIFENIDGWFDFGRFYSKMVSLHGDGSHFVEVGSWKGKSTSYMAVEIANSNKKIKFDCVDTWEGSEEHKDPTDPFYEPLLLEKDGLYNLFIENMKPVEGYYNPVRMESVKAAELYENESLDFVFLDAAHDYDNVKKDIEAWLPKVKKGGYLCGHDAKHPPILQVISEMFGTKCSVIPYQDTWIFKKEL